MPLKDLVSRLCVYVLISLLLRPEFWTLLK